MTLNLQIIYVQLEDSHVSFQLLKSISSHSFLHADLLHFWKGHPKYVENVLRSHCVLDSFSDFMN